MNFLLIFPHYISWHYTKAISDLLNLFKSFSLFIWNMFSINLLLKTLFSPFQRLSVKPERKFDIEAFFSALVTNFLMRIVGFLVRTFFIILGIFSFILFTVFYILFFIAWIAAPLFLVGMFILGTVALFKIPKL